MSQNENPALAFSETELDSLAFSETELASLVEENPSVYSTNSTNSSLGHVSNVSHRENPELASPRGAQSHVSEGPSLCEVNPSSFYSPASSNGNVSSVSHEEIPSLPATKGAYSRDSELFSLIEENPSAYSSNSSVDVAGNHPVLSATERIERIQNIFEAMTQMFGKYFKPQEITKSLQNLDEDERRNILEDSVLNRDGGMQTLLEEVLNADEKLLLEFYKLVTTLDEDTGRLPASLLSGEGIMDPEKVSGLMQFIVQIVEYRKVDMLTATDLTKIVDAMVKEKLMQKPRKSKDNEKPVEHFMSLLKLVKKSKPDWPFHLWNILQCELPDLFSSGTSRENSESFDFSPLVSKENNQNERYEARAEMSPPKSSNLRIYQRLHVKPKDQDSFGLKMLVDSGALDPNKITSEEVKQPKSKIDAWNRKVSYLSDAEEEDEEKEETERKIPHNAASGLDVDLKMREYQKELAKVALQGQNTIICAPTGCGKTRVALEIMIKHLKRGSESKPKKVCFFARTVPLAVQQHNTISKYLPKKYKANIFTGDSEFSSTMHFQLEELDVIVLTPMILMNHIKMGNIDGLKVFSLLIFDECHHAREREAYNNLMCSYMDKKLMGDHELPQVVGLTASFPVEKANNKHDAAESILQLCANLDASTISVIVDNKKELEQTVAVPTEESQQLTERNKDDSYKKIIDVMEILEQEAQDCADEIRQDKITEILSKIPPDRKLQKYNNWAVDLLKGSEELPRTEKETNMSVRLLMIIAKYLAKYHFALETHDLVHLEDVIDYLDNCFAENKSDEVKTSGETRLYDYFSELKMNMKKLCHEDNPNLLDLMQVIETRLLKKGSLSRGIIFVKTRAIADALVSWLNRCNNEEINRLNASIFTGTNAKESQGGMTQSQQNALVEKFREGKVRILVATSVAEEGMDVPECNLVIKYNHVGNEITTIQTRGRSRKVGGHSVLLAMPKICEKEMINRKRTQLMYEGIDIVRKMDRQEFNDCVLEQQKQDAEKREIEQLIADQNKESWKHKKFKLVCKLCRKFCIESEDIRIVCGNHRIVVNKDVWYHSRMNAIEPRYINDTKVVGSAICRCQLVEGATCNSSLGAVVFYSQVYFLAVGIKHFRIEEEGKVEAVTAKKWKDLPFFIEDLSNNDIKRYITPEDNTNSGVQETESANGAYMASFAASIGQESSESAFSEGTLEIFCRYEGYPVGDPAPSDYTLDSQYHDTERKVVVSSDLDSGLDPCSAFDSTE